MNERTLLALGLLLGVGSGKAPEQWLSGAHQYMRDKQGEDQALIVDYDAERETYLVEPMRELLSDESRES